MGLSWIQRTRYLCILGLMLLLALDAVSIGVYFSETRQIKHLVHDLVEPGTPQVDAMRTLTKYLAEDTPNARPDEYFVAPIFSRLRPTAWQVVQHGGDCAYKARAFIVMLRQLDVPASKVALYNGSGKAVHAAAVVNTDRGDYVVDLKYGVVYEDSGRPIPLAELGRRPELFNAVLDREVARGNTRAAEYPRDRFVYSDVRTINWHESLPMSTAYAVLSAIFGAQAINGLTRPYISEEPAFMVLALSFSVKGPLIVIWFLLSRRRTRGAAAVTLAAAR